MEGVAPHIVYLLELFVCNKVDVVSGECNEFVVILEEFVADIVFEDVGV